MAQWLSPTGHIDYSAGWISESLAYNNYLYNYAWRNVYKKTWTTFLGLTHAPMSCTKVRFYASGETTDFTSIDIDVYYNGAWHHVYQGPYTHSSWIEKAIGSTQTITVFRFRFYNNSADESLNAYLHDVDFYGNTIVKPTDTTQAVTNIELTTATGNGNITVLGHENATIRGFCYMVGTSGNPTTVNNKVYDTGSFGTGAYAKGITGLSPGIGYRIRAYAINSAGTGYGTTVQFYTAKIPIVATQAITGIDRIDPSKVDANGNITSIGSAAVTTRGFKYGETEADTWDVHEGGTFGTGVYSLEIAAHLDPDTIYYVRAYAINEEGTSYGAYVQFRTAVPYWSKKIEIKGEATASPEDVKKVGGKKTLVIKNHLIQTQSIAQNIANAYLAEYKDQKIKMVVDRPIPLPYEIGDTIEQISTIFATIPYKPAAEAEIGYKPAAEAEIPYKPVDSDSRDLMIRKINLRFSAGNFIGTIELEG